MSLTGAQHGLYGRLWRAVCAREGWDAKDDAVRVGVHARWGLPVSRADWGNAEMDAWVERCEQWLDPARLAGPDGETGRRLWRLRALLARLGRGDGYALGIVRKMGLAGPLVLLEGLGASALEKVIVALRKQVGRRGRGVGVREEAVGVAVAGAVEGSQGHGTVRGDEGEGAGADSSPEEGNEPF